MFSILRCKFEAAECAQHAPFSHAPAASGLHSPQIEGIRFYDRTEYLGSLINDFHGWDCIPSRLFARAICMDDDGAVEGRGWQLLVPYRFKGSW